MTNEVPLLLFYISLTFLFSFIVFVFNVAGSSPSSRKLGFFILEFCTFGARNENAINHWDGVGVWLVFWVSRDWMETTINMITRAVLLHTGMTINDYPFLGIFAVLLGPLVFSSPFEFPVS